MAVAKSDTVKKEQRFYSLLFLFGAPSMGALLRV